MNMYRYEDMSTEHGVKLWEWVFTVIKETPCGYWITGYDNSFGVNYRSRWVSKTSRKRFAYPTRKEALVGLKARKIRQIEILSGHLEQAQQALDIAEYKLEGISMEGLE